MLSRAPSEVAVQAFHVSVFLFMFNGGTVGDSRNIYGLQGE